MAYPVELQPNPTPRENSSEAGPRQDGKGNNDCYDLPPKKTKEREKSS